jgi:precorrin-2 dehydrogenase/sirohydrochlorin ferrochelatase
MNGAFLAIASTSDEKTNKLVSETAPCLVNVVDKPEIANFIVPSVISRGLLTIAISTAGASPAMAKAIKKELELIYNKDFGQFLAFLKQLRQKAMRDIPDKKARERFLKSVAEKEILSVLRNNGFKAAREKVIKQFNLLKGGSSKP